MLTEILLYAGALTGYSTAGFMVGSITSKLYDPEQNTPAPVLAGLAWPIVLPMMLPFYVYTAANKGLMRLPNRKPKVLQYAEAPMTILANMLCQRIIAYPDAFDYDDRWKKDGITIYYFGRSGNLNWVEVPSKIRFNRNDFTPKDVKNLERAIETGLKLFKEKKAADVLAHRNQSALNAVEKLMDLPIEPSLLTVERN